jgi:hypothetical protein
LFSGPVVFILEKCDKIVNMVCPFLAGSVAAGLYVTFINFSITLWQTGLVEEQVRVPGEITDHMLQINFQDALSLRNGQILA